MNGTNNTSNYILSLADRCVKCGLCLPQCPTYALTANENESPRGRIALIQGWLTGQLTPSETLTTHLDQCLLCRRCERICPSVVPYGEIIDQAKSLLYEKSATKFSLHKSITKFSLKVLLNRKLSSSLISVLRLLQKTGLLFIAQKSQLLKLFGLHRLTAALPKLEKRFKPKHFYPASTKNIQGAVSLFTGCLSNSLDPKLVKASIRLLNHLGYNVHIPEQQVCCGALHLHEGNKKQALNFANSNIKTFNQTKVTTIISLVNGCTSQLREYPQLDTEESFTHEVKDIIEFLSEISEIDWPKSTEFNALNKSVALQIPCSLQNILRAEDKLMTLLQRIPGIKLPPDSIYNRCCGAAGSYFLHFPKISEQLKNLALDKLELSSPELIISSNLGCALQLKAGLTQRNHNIEVIHPVLLLEQQLKFS